MRAEAAEVRRLFGRIARRYDLLNSLLSLGQHLRWKRLAASACQAGRGSLLVDVCSGTADIALAQARGGGRAVAVDFSAPMLAVGRRKAEGQPVQFVLGDALHLPFPDDTFDAATAGFSLRNVASVPRLLGEMARVVRPGGWVVSLETSQPPWRLVRALYRGYLGVVVWLAPLLSDGPAYRWLLRTVVAFSTAEEVAEQFRGAGLREVQFSRLLLGAAAIHAGRVPEQQRGCDRVVTK